MAVTKPILNILIQPTYSPKTLAVGDISQYPNGWATINPTLEITPPSFPKQVLPFSPSNFTVFNANDLNITCDGEVEELPDLPDGVWTIKYTITPSITYFKEIKFIRVDSLKRQLELAFAKLDITQCNEDIKNQDKLQIDQIDYYLNGAIAAANDCNYIAAVNYYTIASKRLTKFINSKC